MQIDKTRLVSIFFDLIKISATSKTERPVADYIRNFLSSIDLDCVEDEAGKKCKGNSGNLIGHFGPASVPPRLAFVAHMDTVKPTAGVNPKIVDNRVLTDGSTILGADNRAGIAIILFLLEFLTKSNVTDQSFEYIFTIGEESGFYGSVNLDLSKLRSDTCYVLDSSADPGAFVYSAPGAMSFDCEIKGKASHAAVHPEQGINALRMSAELIYHFPIGQVDKDTTINFGTIESGEANNVIPAHSVIRGEIRSFDNQKIDNYYQQLEKHLQKITREYGGDYSLKPSMSFPGFCLDIESPAVQDLIKSIQLMDLKAKPLRYHGGSDANILNNRGLVAVNLGIGAKNPHSKNEYIDIKSMINIFRLCHCLLKTGC